MTIFHVLPQFHYVNDRTIIGGYPSAVARLAVAQAENGLKPTIVSRMPAGTPARFADVELSNVENVDATSHRHPLRFLRKVLGFLRLHLNGGDSVIVHSGHAEYAIVSAAARLLLGVGVIHTLYCPVQSGARGLVQRMAIVLARLCGVEFSGMSRYVCKSIPGPSAWTPPVVDHEYFNSEGNAPVECQLLFVGNATPSKGLADLLKAFVDLVNNSNDIEQLRLVVTTELPRTNNHAELRDILNQLQSAAALSRISWLSIVPDMRELLCRSAIHIAPFRDTNGPSDYFMSTLEAMSMGKVCIVSDLPGMAEVVTDGVNGFSFRAGDPEDLKRALKRAINCDRALVGRRAREFVVNNFGLSAVETVNCLYGERHA